MSHCPRAGMLPLGTNFWDDRLGLSVWLAIGLVIASGIKVCVHRAGRSTEGELNAMSNLSDNLRSQYAMTMLAKWPERYDIGELARLDPRR